MIADWCRELASFPESVWIAYAHSREPLRRLVTSEDYANHFHAADFCGVEMARQVRGDWGDISCRELAEKLNVKLEWPAMPEGNGLVTFACYFEPDRIQVYTDNAAATRSLIQESGGVEFLGDVDICEMLLAHELCHVLQHRQPELYTNRKHIRLQKIGPWERRSRLVSLEEVAAMAFAREMLCLSHSPYVYDVLMLLPQATPEAQRLFTQLRQFAEEEAHE